MATTTIGHAYAKKHGDSPDCGRDYTTDESTVTAVCPHCGTRFEATLPEFPRGTVVRHTTKALKSMYGQGGRGAPVNGRIVGSTHVWPIVQWSDGHTSPIAAGALQRVKVRA